MRATQIFRTTFTALALALTCGLAACGGEDDSGNNNNSSSTSETCSHSYECVNGSCACSSGPRKDSSCCDPDSCSGGNACNSYCNVCS